MLTNSHQITVTGRHCVCAFPVGQTEPSFLPQQKTFTVQTEGFQPAGFALLNANVNYDMTAFTTYLRKGAGDFTAMKHACALPNGH